MNQTDKTVFMIDDADNFLLMNQTNKSTVTDSDLDNFWSTSAQTSRVKWAHKNTAEIQAFINYDNNTLTDNELFKILQIYKSAE